MLLVLEVNQDQKKKGSKDKVANDADDKGRQKKGIINVNCKDPEPLTDEFEADEDGMKEKKGR